MPERPSSRRAAMRRIPFAIGAVLIGAVIGFAVVYGIGGLNRNASGDPACRPAVDLARRLGPLAHGEVAALTMATAPLRLPDLAFEDADGKPRKLSEWRGRTVLVNLWATWCVPCRKEMPALDSLQTKLGGRDFEVVAVNIDTRDPEKPKNFGHRSGAGNADFGAGRWRGLRDRQHCRTCGMGQRRRRQADHSGDETGGCWLLKPFRPKARHRRDPGG